MSPGHVLSAEKSFEPQPPSNVGIACAIGTTKMNFASETPNRCHDTFHK
jgi:hypothetical protein